MTARFVFPACVAIALCAALPAHAQWKWRDANGRVQYSDIPPPAAVPDRDILQRPQGSRHSVVQAAPVASAVTTRPTDSAGSDAELEAKRRKLEEAEAVRTAAKLKAEEDKRAAQRREACSQARLQLRTLDDGMRIARINAQGEREYIDDQTRAAETRRAQDAIASDCK